jgi:hypothetical protein
MEEPMFRFERIATIKTAADMPAALQYGTEITSYVNKRYSLNLKFGARLFAEPSLHWYFDVDSLDKGSQLSATLLQDQEYVELLKKNRAIWVEGSLKDTIVTLVA